MKLLNYLQRPSVEIDGGAKHDGANCYFVFPNIFQVRGYEIS